MQNSDKINVVKPVPSRPYSRYKSFSAELLDDAMDVSPATPVPERAVAIKPKTLRFKPSTRHCQNEVGPSQKSLVHEQWQPANINPASYFAHNRVTEEIYENSDLVPVNLKEMKAQKQASSDDRSSYDGHNWRKYGQKQVKGSDYPRSYYKCTHPGCPMKKKVERTFDGQRAEIVYHGEHNHPKPPSPKQLASVPQEHGSLFSSDSPIGGSAYIGSIESYSEGGPLKTLPHQKLHSSHNSFLVTACNQDDETSSIDNDRHKSKKRKNKEKVQEEGIVSQPVGDLEPLLQPYIESNVTGDGFRWRKYGQKVVKGSSFPRSYYRCANTKCNVRKHVERASDDPRSFITTYEGKHNHEMPDKRMHSSASDSESLSFEKTK